MSVLDHPEARALLADAAATPDAVEGQAGRPTAFLQRYLPQFYRPEQRTAAALVIRGRLGGLGRETSEPIAIEAGPPRKPIRFFVGAGKWDDEAVMGELRQHVREELADPDGVVIVDPSGFPKKGAESRGVDRQGCGRPGRVGNRQVGVFLAYAAEAGYAPLGRRLCLPREWADGEARREECHVPEEVEFRETWRIALDLLDRSLPGPARPTAGSSAMTSRAGPPSSAPRRSGVEDATPWTCRATPPYVTRSGVGRPARRPASAAVAGCRPCGPTPGPHDGRGRAGGGSRPATARRGRLESMR